MATINQLSAFAPGIVGVISLVIAAISALIIAHRPPAKIRKQRKEAGESPSLPFERTNNVSAEAAGARQREHA